VIAIKMEYTFLKEFKKTIHSNQWRTTYFYNNKIIVGIE
jgi:hypothetical protein